MHLPPMSHSSTSTLSDSVVTPLAFAGFPLRTESLDYHSPRMTAFLVIELSASTSAAGSEPPTRPSSPPDNVLPAHLERASTALE
jgi:hypothetical protein